MLFSPRVFASSAANCYRQDVPGTRSDFGLDAGLAPIDGGQLTNWFSARRGDLGEFQNPSWYRYTTLELLNPTV